MTAEDIREMIEEAERLEAEATDIRREAVAAIKARGLCRAPGRGGECCQRPYDCIGRWP